MSASNPDTCLESTPQGERREAKAKVVQLPLDADARRRAEAHKLSAELREQLLLLSQHYAADTSRLTEALNESHAKLTQAKAEVEGQRSRAAKLEAELFALRGDLAFFRERLSQERRRASRLADTARLPWWAFARRRWSLTSIDADEAS